MAKWNGTTPPSHLPLRQLASDASGSWVCGAWFESHWFQLQWDVRSKVLPIMVKELLPIVLVWGPQWAGTSVRCLCDNQVIVAYLRSRTTQEKHMLMTLAFVEARHAFCMNTLIQRKRPSRSILCSFLSKVPMQTLPQHPYPHSWWISYWIHS